MLCLNEESGILEWLNGTKGLRFAIEEGYNAARPFVECGSARAARRAAAVRLSLPLASRARARGRVALSVPLLSRDRSLPFALDSLIPPSPRCARKSYPKQLGLGDRWLRDKYEKTQETYKKNLAEVWGPALSLSLGDEA